MRHLTQVASGLDSMVLGEPQILGQMKSAYAVAEEAGTVGAELSRLFPRVFSVAKRVRTDTAIGENPVSVAFAAVNLAGHIFADLAETRALLVGAGVTIELVAKHLYSKEIGRLFVANRDLTRAKKLAAHFDGFALPLSELEGTLPEADILISSTASTEPVVSFEQMKAAVKARKLYTFAEARRKARTYGFTTQDEFIEYECAGTYQLPKNADEVWLEEWTNWDDFLGVPLTFDVAKEVVRQVLVKERGVDSEDTYIALIKSGDISDDELASRLPLRPDLYYKSVWTSWDDFLGNGTA